MASVGASSDDVSMENSDGRRETDSSVLTVDSHGLKSVETDIPKFVSSREVAELIPVFDGNNLPVRSFIRCCRSAESLTPPSRQAYLLQLIRSRVRGNADAFLGSQPITDITKLLNDLKRAFAPTRGIGQYQIDLSTVQQREGESVFNYGMRVNDVLSKGLEAIYDNYAPNLAEGMVAGMKDCAAKSFVRGLKNPLELRMNGRTVKDLNSAIDEAINVEHEVEQRKQLINPDFGKEDNFHSREIFKRVAPYAKRYAVNHMSLESITCHRCSKRGHFAKDCRQPLPSVSQRVGEKRKIPYNEHRSYGKVFKNNNYGIKQKSNNQACQTNDDLNSKTGR